MKKIALKSVMMLAMVFSLVSGCQCSKHDPDKTKFGRVLIFYSEGNNTLRDYLYGDINELKRGYAPAKSGKDVFLIVSHLAVSRGNYSTPTYPYLIRVYKDKKKGVVLDTLKAYTDGNILVGEGDMKAVLNDIHTQFPAEHYGMVYSSHASGWLPNGYYSNPNYYERGSSFGARRAAGALPKGAVPYREPEDVPGAPAVKSIGMCNQVSGGTVVSYEMELTDFADAFPMKFDYLLLDACLSGGIEVAYELKDKVGVIGFSPTEILADGFNYKTLASRLLEGDTDVEAVVDDYFQQYASKTDASDRAATVSLVDCSKLEDLAGVCRTLFDKYADSIASLDPDSVQRFYRNSNHWFYDLEDILVKAGISQEEHRSLTAALDRCIIYKAATEAFLYAWGGFKIDTYSGLSMYLPCNGSAFLDSRYKQLAWNKATGLVD